MKRDNPGIATFARPIITIDGLNSAQQRAYKMVQLHSTLDIEKPLLLRMEGTAGTGKSHVINAWANLLSEDSYVLCAPTGKAACNIGGVTLHSTLCIFSGNRDKQLKGMQLQSLQEKFKSIKYLIVDE